MAIRKIKKNAAHNILEYFLAKPNACWIHTVVHKILCNDFTLHVTLPDLQCRFKIIQILNRAVVKETVRYNARLKTSTPQLSSLVTACCHKKCISNYETQYSPSSLRSCRQLRKSHWKGNWQM